MVTGVLENYVNQVIGYFIRSTGYHSQMTERFNFICPSPEQLETNVGIELLLGTERVPIVFFKNFSNRFAGPPFQPIHFLKIIELIFKLLVIFMVCLLRSCPTSPHWQDRWDPVALWD
jgi:hypothetical protein